MVINHDLQNTKKRVYRIVFARRQTISSLERSVVTFMTQESTLKRLSRPGYDWCCRQVRKWLHHVNLGHLSKLFHNYSGSDLLKLDKEDIYLICGPLNGKLLLDSLRRCMNIRLKLNETSPQSIPTLYAKNKLQVFIRFESCLYHNVIYISINPKIDTHDFLNKLKRLMLELHDSKKLLGSDGKKFKINESDEFTRCSQEDITIEDLHDIYVLDEKRKLKNLCTPSDENKILINKDGKYILILISVNSKNSILLVSEDEDQ